MRHLGGSMTHVTRRNFLGLTAAGAALAAGIPTTFARAAAAPAPTAAKAAPITAAEHAARIAKLQSIMQREKVAALLVESGHRLEVFTGIARWRETGTCGL